MNGQLLPRHELLKVRMLAVISYLTCFTQLNYNLLSASEEVYFGHRLNCDNMDGKELNACIKSNSKYAQGVYADRTEWMFLLDLA